MLSIIEIAIGITIFIQTKLDNKRALKEHFISEVLSVRNDYRKLIASLKTGEARPKQIQYQLQGLSIHLNGMMKFLNKEFNIQRGLFYPYLIDLSCKITDEPAYVENYREDKCIHFNDSFLYQLDNFEAEHDYLFNDVILKINEA